MQQQNKHTTFSTRARYYESTKQQENTHTYPVFEFLREIEISTKATTQQENAHTTFSTRAGYYESTKQQENTHTYPIFEFLREI